MLQLKVNHPLFLPSTQRPGGSEESHQAAGCGRMDMETGKQSLEIPSKLCGKHQSPPRIPAAWEHWAPGLRMMPKCLLLRSQALRPSALQNSGHWRRRKANGNNIHFPSNFKKAWTLPQLPWVLLFVVICEIRKRFCGHQWWCNKVDKTVVTPQPCSKLP